MNFEDALRAARADLSAPAPVPAFVEVEAAVRWRQSSPARPGPRARWLATAAAGVGVLTLATDAAIGLVLQVPLLASLVLTVIVLAITMVLVHRRTLCSQLSTRAIWWAYLLFGVAWSLGPPESLPAAGSLLAVSTGVALLAAGRSGLRRPETAAVFDPSAFRGNVLLSMIFGLAGAQVLAQVGLLYAESGLGGAHPWALLACAALLAVGVVGMSRLRVWAVLLNLAVNAVVIALLLFASRLSGALLWILVGSAAVQLLLPVRMLLAFRRGAAPRDRDTELPALLAVIVILVLMLASIPCGLYGTYAVALGQ